MARVHIDWRQSWLLRAFLTDFRSKVMRRMWRYASPCSDKSGARAEALVYRAAGELLERVEAGERWIELSCAEPSCETATCDGEPFYLYATADFGEGTPSLCTVVDGGAAPSYTFGRESN